MNCSVMKNALNLKKDKIVLSKFYHSHRKFFLGSLNASKFGFRLKEKSINQKFSSVSSLDIFYNSIICNSSYSLRHYHSTGIRTFKNEPKMHLFTPLPVVYDDCDGAEIVGPLERKKINRLLSKFDEDESIKELAIESGLDSYLYREAFSNFKKFCLSGAPLPTDLHIVLHDLTNNSGHIHDIYPFFLRHSQKVFPHLKCIDELTKISDLTIPPNW